jgi:hypothetical protein
VTLAGVHQATPKRPQIMLGVPRLTPHQPSPVPSPMRNHVFSALLTPTSPLNLSSSRLLQLNHNARAITDLPLAYLTYLAYFEVPSSRW